jgi:hypothetical protein
MGNEGLPRWRPSAEEVERIIAEMRPMLAELARHPTPELADNRA